MLRVNLLAGETITAPTNTRTGVVQFTAFGCKGFEQKEFNQTKGISMAGSPTYTANASLDSTFGNNKVISRNNFNCHPSDYRLVVAVMDGSDANGADSRRLNNFRRCD